MNYRELGRTGWKVSEISFGAWAIGGSWGTVDDRESLAALHKAVDLGGKFLRHRRCVWGRPQRKAPGPVAEGTGRGDYYCHESREEAKPA